MKKNQPKSQLIEVTLEKSETLTIRRSRTIATRRGHAERRDTPMSGSGDANAMGRAGDLGQASSEETDQQRSNSK
jgi:hypothetical protein